VIWTEVGQIILKHKSNLHYVNKLENTEIAPQQLSITICL